jgi:hypothetical protein
LFDDKARVPRDKSGKPIVDRAQERIDFLVQTMSYRKDKIIVPSPALAEFMLLASDKWNEYLTIIRRKSVFEIAGFDDPLGGRAGRALAKTRRSQKTEAKHGGDMGKDEI